MPTMQHTWKPHCVTQVRSAPKALQIEVKYWLTRSPFTRIYVVYRQIAMPQQATSDNQMRSFISNNDLTLGLYKFQ